MGGFAEYEEYDAVGLAELVRKKQVTPDELLDAAIERVEARNDAVNAVISRADERARQTIKDGLPDGPFSGVPFLLKDISGSQAGDTVTRGSNFFKDTPPVAQDSEHVGRLKQSGLVIFGRTNSCELGLSLTCEPQAYGPTKSPWDTTRISGGSSGGAAASVGARMLPMAHAHGRVRVDPRPRRLLRAGRAEADARRGTPRRRTPARGSAAARPSTRSRCPCATLPPCWMRPRERARAIRTLRRPPRVHSFRRREPDPGKLRIAFTTKAPNGAPVAPEYLETLAMTAKLCADLGHHVEEADPEIDGELVVPTFVTLAAVNTVVNLGSHPTKGRPAQKGEVETVTWDTGQARRADLGRRLRARHPDGASAGPADGSVPPAVRPAADAGAGHVAAAARLDRHDAGRRARVLAAGLHVLAVHRLVQPHGAAGHDAADRAERDGLPDRGAAGGPVRRRGSLDPPRQPAGSGQALVQPQAAGRPVAVRRGSHIPPLPLRGRGRRSVQNCIHHRDRSSPRVR